MSDGKWNTIRVLISGSFRVSEDTIYTNLVLSFSRLGSVLQYIAAEVNYTITGRHAKRFSRQTAGELRACSLETKHLASIQKHINKASTAHSIIMTRRK